MKYLKNIWNALLAKEIKTQIVYSYEITATAIKRPNKHEMVIIQIPSNTPELVAKELADRITEFVNSDREFLMLSIPITIIESNKSMIEVKQENGTEKTKTRPSRED